MKPNQNKWYTIENNYSKLLADNVALTTDNHVPLATVAPFDPVYADLLDNRLWMFVPLNHDYYAIVNKLSGKVAYVETSGKKHVYQYYWENVNNQQWFLHDLEGGLQKIQSKHSGEVWDGDMNNEGPFLTQQLWNGRDAQRWAIREIKSFTLPSIQTSPLAPPPKYKNIDDVLPDRTEMVTTNYTLAPCIAVSDPYLNDQQKIQTNPYYLYVRKQYWRKVGSHVLAPGTKYGYKQTSGITTTDQRTVTNTVSHTFGADVGLSFGNLNTGKKSLSAALSYQYSNELSVQESRTDTELSVVEEAFTIENANNYSVAWTKYILVSQYSVHRVDGTIVNEAWTVTDYHNTYDRFYPEEGGNGIIDSRVSAEEI